MKVIHFIPLLVLFCTTIWFGKQTITYKEQLAILSDTLSNIQKYEFDRGYLSGIPSQLESILQEKSLEKNDSVMEAHRIIATYNHTLYLFRVESLQNHTVWLMFKKCSEVNPLTGEGRNALLASSRQPLNGSILQSFKEKLEKIEFMDAASVNDNLQYCYDGGSIELQSVFPGDEKIRFRTYCRQSNQFAMACELLMRQVNDSELQKILRGEDELMEVDHPAMSHFKSIR